VAEDDDDPFSSTLQSVERVSDDLTADALALDGGSHGHRCERGGVDGSTGSVNPHAADQSVADNLLLQFTDHGEQDDTFSPELFHKICFGRTAKGGLVHPADAGMIVGPFGADDQSCC
jgi:hypothetical protein